MKYCNYEIVPALYKCFDEGLVNSRDHYIRQQQKISDGKHKNIRPVTLIDISVDLKTGIITLLNNGDGIDIAKHPTEGMWIVEMIFAHLMSSTNYNKDDLLAFKAEKNAYLKEYPNKFTNLSDILSNFEFFGFKLDKLYIFPRRGDMGKINFKEQSNVIKDAYIGYEYVILCHKVKDTDTNNLIGKSFDSPFSKSAVEIANQKGYLSPNDLFNSIGID